MPSVLALAVLSSILIYLFGGQPGPAAASAPSASATPATTGAPASAAASARAATYIPPSGKSGQAALKLLGSKALPLPSQAMPSAKAWNAGRGGAELNAVTGDLGAVTQEAGVRNFVLMKAGCRTLAAQVRVAQSAPPIPEAGMQALYAKALTTLADGASACQAAISQRPDGDETVVTTENQTELHRATSDFASGAKDMYRATAEIQAVSRH